MTLKLAIGNRGSRITLDLEHVLRGRNTFIGPLIIGLVFLLWLLFTEASCNIFEIFTYLDHTIFNYHA